jgi:hypothetical protein
MRAQPFVSALDHEAAQQAPPTLSDLPEWATLTLTSGTMVLQNYQFAIKAQDFLGNLQDFKNPMDPSQPLNVWVFGAAGTGKTSFLMTMATLVSNDEAPPYGSFKIGGADDHVTTTVEGLNLMRSHVPVPLRIYDTWGIDDNNYSDRELERMVSIRHANV